MRDLWIQRVIDALDVVSEFDLDLVVDPRFWRYFQDQVPQRCLGYSPHGQSTRQAENSLGEVNLVGLTSEDERAVTAFNDGDLPTSKELVHHRFIDRARLLESVDGDSTGAASR